MDNHTTSPIFLYHSKLYIVFLTFWYEMRNFPLNWDFDVKGKRYNVKVVIYLYLDRDLYWIEINMSWWTCTWNRSRNEVSPHNVRILWALKNHFLVKIWLSKTYFSNFYEKSPVDLNSGSSVHKTNALDHWAMKIYNKIDRYKQFHRIFKSPCCDVG